MGRKSPPPPTIIMPPPPPPPQVVTEVTPQETYQDASDYLRRIHERDKFIEQRRWDSGYTPGARAATNALAGLQAAENAMRLAGGPITPTFGSQNLGGTEAIINQLSPKPTQGSASRQVRIKPTVQGGLPATLGTKVTGPAARLSAAQDIYAKALAQKTNEQFSYPEFQEPSWADRDWYPSLQKWDDRSEYVELGDDTPRKIPLT